MLDMLDASKKGNFWKAPRGEGEEKGRGRVLQAPRCWGTIPSGSPRNPSGSNEPHGGNVPPLIRFFVFRLDLIAVATTSTRFKVSHV